MTRFLLALAAFILLIYVLRRLAGTGGRPASRGARGAAPAHPTEMVRDRVCNTFLPRERALQTIRDGETHHFCSEDCRSRFLAGLAPARTRTAP
ncbi:MAG: hypothetical protein ACREAA_18760 [Candidatus Polarisedimenticolia bacterium]